MTKPEGVWIFAAQGDLKPGIGKEEYGKSQAFREVDDRADEILGERKNFPRRCLMIQMEPLHILRMLI